MEEYLYKWKSTDHIGQFMEQLRLDLLEDNQASTIVLRVSLDRNYGFVFKTKNYLTVEDRTTFLDYLNATLIEFGYRLVRGDGQESIFQASVRSRVNGNQLFGTIKVMDLAYEIRLLVTPYNDRSYSQALKEKELIDVLFA